LFWSCYLVLSSLIFSLIEKEYWKRLRTSKKSRRSWSPESERHNETTSERKEKKTREKKRKQIDRKRSDFHLIRRRRRMARDLRSREGLGIYTTETRINSNPF
jgi:hypothetical protein